MRLARVPPPKNPSGLWSAKHNGSTVKVGQIRLLLKEPNGAGGEAMTFDWTPDGEVLKMNAACRRPRIKCLGCRAI
jgi:hypothetical protein